MTIQIVSHTKENGNQYFLLQADKKSAFVGVTPHYITVACQNMMHKVYRGAGRTFWGGWQEAIDAYKSPEMKEMIRAAKNLFDHI